MTKLHIGCGARIIPGWVNIDLDPPADMIHDVRTGLPFPDGSVEMIYNEHTHEHLTLPEGDALLREYYRVLKPGGVLRMSVPSLDWLLDEYYAGNLDWATEVGWRPATPCQMVNEAMRSWGHQFLYSESELRDSLKAAGFIYPMLVPWQQTSHEGLPVEGRPNLGELIFEAIK